MSETVDFDIVGSYNDQRVSSIDSERSINMFEYVDPLGKKPKTLINTSGLIDTEFEFDAQTGPFRAQFVFLGNQYVVVGNEIFRITPVGTNSLVGTINTAVGYVGVDANTFQIIFVDGTNGYIWDNTDATFTQITDTSFPANPIDVCYLDGFFVVANGGTNTFQLSEFNQGLVWGPDTQTFTADDTGGNNWLILASTANYQTGVSFSVTTTGSLPNPLVTTTTYYAIRVDATHIRVASSYANAIAGTAIVLTSNGTPTNTIISDGQLQLGAITSHPGNIVACKTLHRRLFLFSENYTEVWENAGVGTNLPFRRNNSLLMEYGTPAIASVSVGFDMMFFLSQDSDGQGSVMMVRGTDSLPCSNRALDFTLAQYAADQAVTDCTSFLIKENGLIFYRMNFTKANHTYVFNATLSNPAQEETKYWHEEETLDYKRHPSQTHAYFNGINYVGSYLGPILYQVDSQTYTNAEQNIRRTRITRPIVPPGYQRIRIDRLQIDILQGSEFDLFPIQEQIVLDTQTNADILTQNGRQILLQQTQTIFDGTQTPYVFLSISRDGGQSYGYRIKAPIGKIGQRTFRTLWRKLGVIPRGQAFVAKFEFYDAIPFIILGASWAIEVLPE